MYFFIIFVQVSKCTTYNELGNWLHAISVAKATCQGHYERVIGAGALDIKSSYAWYTWQKAPVLAYTANVFYEAVSWTTILGNNVKVECVERVVSLVVNLEYRNKITQELKDCSRFDDL